MKEDNKMYNVVLCSKVRETFDRYIRDYNFDIEAGGILIGKIVDEDIVICDITEPYEKDTRGRYIFKRSAYGHQEYMDDLWSKSDNSLTYLGEWHTHDQKNIRASCVDYRNWHKIMRRNHNADVLVFLIVGRQEITVWIGYDGKLLKKGVNFINDVFQKNT